MTYCVGVLLDEGLVLASDTRTNAGVDQVAIFPKMHKFEVPGERIIVLLTAGNLAITQSVVSRLREAVLKNEGKHLKNVDSLFEAASLVGDQVRVSFERDAEHLKNHNADFHASIIVAGQIKGEKPRLFNIYNAGNFIEASIETGAPVKLEIMAPLVFAQAELDVLRNYPNPGKSIEESRGYGINVYPYYDLNYYSKGRGKILGIYNKMLTKDGELLNKLLAS